MPKPRKDETKEEFLDRCMSDEEAIQDFPDEKQRLAFCHSQWDNERGGHIVFIEYRNFATELRASSEPEEGVHVIGGRGVPYGDWSADLGGMKERFLPGAFKESVATDDIRSLAQHNAERVLGRVSANTLTLQDKEEGVFYEARAPDTVWVRDLVLSIQRRDIRENSFGFWIEDWKMDQDWLETEGVLYRTVKRARMLELGPQTFAAYPTTSVGVRGLEVRPGEFSSLLEEGRAWIEAHRGHGDPDLLALIEEEARRHP